MSLLERWRAKKSWQTTLPLCQVYVSKRTNECDLSLSALCSKEPKLTLNRRKGFNEIGICDVKDEIPTEYFYLTYPLKKLTLSAVDISKMLISEIEKYFIELWDSNKFHLVFCSAGMDSRIMSWVLARLRDKMGKDWLGEIHFRCHEPEGWLFKKAMKRQGWKLNQYSIYKEGRLNEPSYFNIGDFKNDVNAFHRPFTEFWDDLVERETEGEVVLITASGGGELFSYPTGKMMDNPLFVNYTFTKNRYNDLIKNARGINVNFTRLYHRWYDILTPFFGYNYLDVAFRVPDVYFKWTKMNCYSDAKFTRRMKVRDLIRSHMMKQFKDDLPVYVGHQYNFKISNERADHMRDSFLRSKFYRDFKHLKFVATAKPWRIYKRGLRREIIRTHPLGPKLYGYATMYENIKCVPDTNGEVI